MQQMLIMQVLLLIAFQMDLKLEQLMVVLMLLVELTSSLPSLSLRSKLQTLNKV